MGQNIAPVSITLGDVTRRFSVAFQCESAHATEWKQTLLKAHGRAVVRCLCRQDEQPRRLSVRYHSHSDLFFLARFPETGHQHDPDCIYYSPDPARSGLGSYRRGVVEELPDGRLKIKLKVGLQRRATADEIATEPREPTVSSSQPGKPAMTLLALLHLLWTTAGFNRWSPRMSGKRNLGLVAYHVAQAARNIRAGRAHLSGALLMGANQPGGKIEARNAEVTALASKQDRRLVAIATLARFKEEYEANVERPPIMGFQGFPYLILQPGHWDHTRTRFTNAYAAWRNGERVVAILQLDVPKEQSESRHLAEVTDLALMYVTKDWIPVDSALEATVCDALVDQSRRFEKPLAFDSGQEAVFPDFWLQDQPQDVPMEVWGMNTPEYLDRKAQKIAYYESNFGADGWWGWNAAAGEPMPPIPGRVGKPP